MASRGLATGPDVAARAGPRGAVAGPPSVLPDAARAVVVLLAADPSEGTPVPAETGVGTTTEASVVAGVATKTPLVGEPVQAT